MLQAQAVVVVARGRVVVARGRVLATVYGAKTITGTISSRHLKRAQGVVVLIGGRIEIACSICHAANHIMMDKQGVLMIWHALSLELDVTHS